MFIEVSQRRDDLFALFRIKRTFELNLDFLAFLKHKRFGTSKRTLIFIFFDTVHTLEAKVLATGTFADVWFFSDIVTDSALIFGCFFCALDVIFGFKSLHKNYCKNLSASF